MPEKILIIGLGNPILGDDGAGWHAARAVARHFARPLVHQRLPQNFPELPEQTQWPSGWIVSSDGKHSIEVDCLSVGGLGLMERLVGYQHVIILDAIISPAHPCGVVLQFPLQDLPAYGDGHSASVHDVSLQQALEMGRALGAELPENIYIVGIVTNPTFEFGENLSQPSATAVLRAAAVVVQWLDEKVLVEPLPVITENVPNLPEVKP